MSAVSSTFEAHHCMHSVKSAISLSLKTIARANQGSLAINSGQNVDPTHASLRSQTAIMITTSDSPRNGEWDAQSITR
jgi:hypothetical protein